VPDVTALPTGTTVTVEVGESAFHAAAGPPVCHGTGFCCAYALDGVTRLRFSGAPGRRPI